MGLQTWGSPQALYDYFNTRYHYTLDLCAEAWSAKAEDFCSLPDDDGLLRNISGRRVWCNPPYNDVGPWVAKALSGGASIFTLLVPANTDQQWFSDLAGVAAIEFIRGRVSFVPPPEYVGPRYSARFPVMACHIGPSITPGFSVIRPPRK